MVAGIRIYGTPWSVGSGFHGWAYQEDEDVLEGVYRRIPEGMDILLSHSPPLGWCDAGPSCASFGSSALLATVQRIQPGIVVCGHVHGGRGSAVRRGDAWRMSPPWMTRTDRARTRSCS